MYGCPKTQHLSTPQQHLHQFRKSTYQFASQNSDVAIYVYLVATGVVTDIVGARNFFSQKCV